LRAGPRRWHTAAWLWEELRSQARTALILMPGACYNLPEQGITHATTHMTNQYTPIRTDGRAAVTVRCLSNAECAEVRGRHWSVVSIAAEQAHTHVTFSDRKECEASGSPA
jgi:hypothetical protein